MAKSVTVEKVLSFFERIDGVGNYDGHPRNEGVPAIIRTPPV